MINQASSASGKAITVHVRGTPLLAPTVVRYSSGAPASLLPVRRCTNCATRMMARPSTPLGGAFVPRVPRGVTSMLMPPAPVLGGLDRAFVLPRRGGTMPGGAGSELVLRASRAPAHDAGIAGQRGSVAQSRRPDRPVGAVCSPGAEFPPQPVLAGHARALKAGK